MPPEPAASRQPVCARCLPAALEKTVLTGEAHSWSRSRQVLWRKGAISGLIQQVVEMRIDDDQDAVWLWVDIQSGTQSGPASCYVGYRIKGYARFCSSDCVLAAL